VNEQTPLTPNAVTPDTALRLARFFRTSPELWLTMQVGYDLKREAAIKADEIAAIEERESALRHASGSTKFG